MADCNATCLLLLAHIYVLLIQKLHRTVQKHDRAVNWSHEELAVLSAFVHEHSALLFGTSTKEKKAKVNVEKVKIHYWKKAADVLKANGGHQRDWERIRKKWQDVYSKARAYHREFLKTGV